MISKLSFKRLKKSKFLLIDDFERNLFKNKNIEVFSFRKIYIRYLFKINFKKLNFINSIKNIYIDNILNEIQPSIIVADNHTIYLKKLKKIRPNLITLLHIIIGMLINLKK